MKMLHKFRIALAATIVALAAVSAADSASALNPGFGSSSGYYYGGGFMFGMVP
jgi:hypothetical protein